MSVTVDDVRGVAALARLELTPQEEERLTGELNRILEYMDKLNELDTEGVGETGVANRGNNQLTDSENLLEEFKPRETFHRGAPRWTPAALRRTQSHELIRATATGRRAKARSSRGAL